MVLFLVLYTVLHGLIIPNSQHSLLVGLAFRQNQTREMHCCTN